jgi:hypothetical protein
VSPPEEPRASKRVVGVFDDRADPVADSSLVPRLVRERLERLRPV